MRIHEAFLSLLSLWQWLSFFSPYTPSSSVPRFYNSLPPGLAGAFSRSSRAKAPAEALPTFIREFTSFGPTLLGRLNTELLFLPLEIRANAAAGGP